MISLLVTLLIGALILAIVLWIVDLLPAVPANIKGFIRIVVLIIFALWLIGLLLGLAPGVHFR